VRDIKHFSVTIWLYTNDDAQVQYHDSTLMFIVMYQQDT